MEPWNYEPARDLDLPPIERAKSLRREPGLFETAGHLAWQLSTRAFFATYHRLSVVADGPILMSPPS